MARGVDAVILRSTEILLPVKLEDSNVSLFDTTARQVEAAVDLALADDRALSQICRACERSS